MSVAEWAAMCTPKGVAQGAVHNCMAAALSAEVGSAGSSLVKLLRLSTKARMSTMACLAVGGTERSGGGKAGCRSSSGVHHGPVPARPKAGSCVTMAPSPSCLGANGRTATSWTAYCGPGSCCWGFPWPARALDSWAWALARTMSTWVHRGSPAGIVMMRSLMCVRA